MLRYVLTLLFALLLVAAPGLAQQTGPIRLAPLPPPEPSEEPVAEPSAQPEEDPANVLIRGLEAVDEDAVGVIGDENGGLGQDMWRGTSRADAVRLLRNLPDTFANRAARDLARRLLLTVATPPADSVDGARLLAERMERLVSMGAVDDALALSAAVSSRDVPDHLARSVVHAHFLRGDTRSGCDVVGQYTGGYAEPFWQKALIVCQIATDKGAEASLGLDLLREEGVASGTVFQDVAHAAAVGAEITPEQLAQPGGTDVLMYTLLAVANAELPDWILATDDPGLIRAILSSANVDGDRKLEVAQRAFRAGLVTGRDVAEIYNALEVPDDTLAAALLDPESVEPVRWPAYLFLAAQRQTLPNARSEALWEAWTLSEAAQVDDIVLATTAPLLENVPVTIDFGWLAATATRAALLAGEDELALEWYQLVLRQARAVADMARSATLLWPGMRVIGRAQDAAPQEAAADEVSETESAPSPVAETAVAQVAVGAVVEMAEDRAVPRDPVPWSESRLSRWIDLAAAANETGEGSRDIGNALYYLEVLGDPVTDAHWQAIPSAATGNGGMPDVSVLVGLARAAEAGRRAETVLLALIALGQAGDNPHPSLVGTVADALDRVGLGDAGRAIVRDGLVAGSL